MLDFLDFFLNFVLGEDNASLKHYELFYIVLRIKKSPAFEPPSSYVIAFH